MATYTEITNNVLNDSKVDGLLKKSSLSEDEQYELVYSIVSNFSGIKRHPDKLFMKKNLPKEYVSFDIETTGRLKTDKITQIAAVKVKNGTEIDYFDSYVNVGDFEIPIQISYLTGIDKKTLSEAPSLETVMETFIEFIGKLPLIGHNATTFDIPFIERTCGIDLRPRLAIDTVSYARACPLDTDDVRLETLKIHYNIQSKLHNALEDCRATYKIFEYMRNNQFLPISDTQECKQIFEGLSFAYTGALQMGRKQFEELVRRYGGKINKSVTKKTDYLVVGPQIAQNLTDGIHSSKELKYFELVENGNPIQKITEEDFLQLMNGE